jgi:hypothetical protein
MQCILRSLVVAVLQTRQKEVQTVERLFIANICACYRDVVIPKSKFLAEEEAKRKAAAADSHEDDDGDDDVFYDSEDDQDDDDDSSDSVS